MGKFKTFLKVLLSLAVLAVVVVAVLWLVNFLGSPQGLYVSYNGVAYGNTALGSSSGGCVIPYGQTVTFTIGNANGWDVYSVQDCTVTVIPNVDDTHDFEFAVNGSERPSAYSGETDLTAAFCDDYDGNGLPVSSDGTFTLAVDELTVADILNAVYAEGVTADGEYFLSDYPYIALSVTSPDGSETLYIPLRLSGMVSGVELDKDGIVF